MKRACLHGRTPQNHRRVPSCRQERRAGGRSRAAGDGAAFTSLLFIIWPARHAVVSHQLIPRTGDQGLFKPLVITFGLVSAVISFFHMDVLGQNNGAILGRKRGTNGPKCDRCRWMLREKLF